MPIGKSTFPVDINTRYTECSTHGENGWVPCLLPGLGVVGGPPRLPNGTYELTLVATEGLKVKLPKAMTVHVTTTDCATNAAQTVTVPNVLGKPLAMALRIVRRKGLEVIVFGTDKSDPTGRSARVFAQEPSSGDKVPTGSCIGFRTTIPGLPVSLATWLRQHASPVGSGHATSADWVLTTHGQASSIVSGGGAPDPSAPVYLIDFHGKFVWNHSCPAGAAPSACVSRGNDAVFTLDPQTLTVLDFGVETNTPDLARFGVVGHVSL